MVRRPAPIIRLGRHLGTATNWAVASGILGDTPAEIVDVHESHTQLAFRVAAIWEEAGA
jgi:hypothetical protein